MTIATTKLGAHMIEGCKALGLPVEVMAIHKIKHVAFADLCRWMLDNKVGGTTRPYLPSLFQMARFWSGITHYSEKDIETIIGPRGFCGPILPDQAAMKSRASCPSDSEMRECFLYSLLSCGFTERDWPSGLSRGRQDLEAAIRYRVWHKMVHTIIARLQRNPRVSELARYFGQEPDTIRSGIKR